MIQCDDVLMKFVFTCVCPSRAESVQASMCYDSKITWKMDFPQMLFLFPFKRETVTLREGRLKQPDLTLMRIPVTL